MGAESPSKQLWDSKQGDTAQRSVAFQVSRHRSPHCDQDKDGKEVGEMNIWKTK